MEAIGCETSIEANLSFQRIPKLPLKKRKQPMMSFEQPSMALAIETQEMNDSRDKGKALLLDRNPPEYEPEQKTRPERDELEPSFEVFLQSKEVEKGGSSNNPVSRNPNPVPIVCKFCGQHFSSTQALGGHQNAHKHERELQKAMKAAQEFNTSLNPFNIHPFQAFQGTIRAPPYFHGYYNHGYAHRGYAFGLGQPGLGRALDGLVGPSFMDPRWASPLRRSRWPTNFDSVAATNLTSFLQQGIMENESGPPNKKQFVGNKFGELDLSVKKNESTELDLTLRL